MATTEHVPVPHIYREKIGDTSWDIQERDLDVFDDVRLWSNNPRLIPYLAGAEAFQSEDDLEAALQTTPGYQELKRSIAEIGQLEPIYVWKDHAMDRFLVFEGATRVTILRELSRAKGGRDSRYRRVRAKVLPPDFTEQHRIILLARIHVRGQGVRSWGRYVEAKYIYDNTTDDGKGHAVLSISDMAKWMGKSVSWVSRLRSAYSFARRYVEYLDSPDAERMAMNSFSLLEEISKAPGFGPKVSGENADEGLRAEVFEMVKRGVFKEYRDARFLKDFYEDPEKWALLKSGQPGIASRLAAEVKAGGATSVHGKISALYAQVKRAADAEEEFDEHDLEELQKCARLVADRLVGVNPLRLALQEFVKALREEATPANVEGITPEEYGTLKKGLATLEKLMAAVCPWWEEGIA